MCFLDGVVFYDLLDRDTDEHLALSCRAYHTDTFTKLKLQHFLSHHYQPLFTQPLNTYRTHIANILNIWNLMSTSSPLNFMWEPTGTHNSLRLLVMSMCVSNGGGLIPSNIGDDTSPVSGYPKAKYLSLCRPRIPALSTSDRLHSGCNRCCVFGVRVRVLARLLNAQSSLVCGRNLIFVQFG